MSIDQSWRPDWMDLNPGVYPDHGDDLSSWAWEFMRRNPEYQADYARWAGLPDDDGNGNKSPKYDLNLGDWVPMEFCESLPSIPALSGETAGEYERRTGQWPDTLLASFQRKWQVDPVSPSFESGPEYGGIAPPYSMERVDDSLVMSSGPYLRDQNLYRGEWGREDDPFVDVVCFDVRFSIDEQFEAVRGALLDRQRGNTGLFGNDPVDQIKRPQTKKEDTYEILLRYLDAIAAGASDQHIINKLYPGESSASTSDIGNCDEEIRLERAGKTWLDRVKKASNRVMTGGYRSFFLFDLIPRTKKDEKRRISRKK